MFERTLSSADGASIQRAEKEVYFSLVRVEQKAISENEEFRRLDIDFSTTLSSDNRISGFNLFKKVLNKNFFRTVLFRAEE